MTLPQTDDHQEEPVTEQDPYAESPDAGNTAPCNCGGAWHAMQQHCVDWPCPGCDRICPREPGTA